ncbi:uncharacterized protein Dwil_GK19058 [Drosophila willistoni]|uniref:Uncharacterized protein n=1 Tax=Drosophila willistoni TaxID=7260 RepID=B4MUG1_DROWI|nr:uncharacterized protein LOC6642098 [Drosophila willistoni]EDW76087.1 uncharacterized protein Dwil_GK19058 [Drosophila willistoni]
MATNDDEDHKDRQAGESDHVIISIGDEPNVIHLPDANIEATDTDNLERTESRHITFLIDESPNTSRQNAEEAKALVKDLLEIIIPQSETSESSSNSDSTATICEPTSASYFPEGRLHHILELLNHFTRNLETLEQQALSQKQEVRVQTGNHYPLLDTMSIIEVPPQQCEFGTQTMSTSTNSSRRSLRLNVTTMKTVRKTRSFRCNQQHPDNRPPCERTHHTITISTNAAAARRAANNRQRSLAARLCQTLSDFAAAVCLCIHVNKDCVFCLGFFLAFVVSASFLTAFFYRTITFNATAVRAPIDALTSGTPNVVPVRFNGAYYYLYKGHKP